MKLLTATGVGLLLSGMLALVWIYWLNPPDFAGNPSSPVALLLVLGPLALGIVSFALARVPMRRIHTRTLAAIFVICTLSVPATIIYAQASPTTVGCLGCGGRVIVSGSIIVPSGHGNGTLSVEVRDSMSLNVSLTKITFSNIGLANSTTIPNVSSMVLLYQGTQVSPTNPLPDGATAAGSLQVSNVTAGADYVISVQGSFQSGGSWGSILSITAQD